MLFGYVSYQVVVTEALKDVSFGRNASLSVHAACWFLSRRVFASPKRIAVEAILNCLHRRITSSIDLNGQDIIRYSCL